MAEAEPTGAVRMTAAQARAIVAEFVAESERRLATFRAEVHARGGPADRLDGSIPSLDPLWSWFLQQKPAPVSEEVARARGPWWSALHWPWVMELGTDLAHVATGQADYFHACALAAHPGEWRICRRRSSPEFERPVLALEGRGEVPYSVPLVIAVRAFQGDPGAGPGELRHVLERWLGHDAAHEAALARLARPLGRFAVERLEDGPFTHRVDVDESVARFQRGRLARLVVTLSGNPRVEAAHEEDREVLLVRAPELSADELLGLVDQLWSETRRPA